MKHLRRLLAILSAGGLAVQATVRRARNRAGAAIRFVWDATDNEDRVIFTGMVLIGVGISRINTAAALIAVGVLLILAKRPLRSWF